MAQTGPGLAAPSSRGRFATPVVLPRLLSPGLVALRARNVQPDRGARLTTAGRFNPAGSGEGGGPVAHDAFGRTNLAARERYQDVGRGIVTEWLGTLTRTEVGPRHLGRHPRLSAAQLETGCHAAERTVLDGKDRPEHDAADRQGEKKATSWNPPST